MIRKSEREECLSRLKRKKHSKCNLKPNDCRLSKELRRQRGFPSDVEIPEEKDFLLKEQRDINHRILEKLVETMDKHRQTAATIRGVFDEVRSRMSFIKFHSSS